MIVTGPTEADSSDYNGKVYYLIAMVLISVTIVHDVGTFTKYYCEGLIPFRIHNRIQFLDKCQSHYLFTKTI